MTTVSQLIETPFIRLDAFLKLIGLVDSGGQAKHRIQEGGYLVNGVVCTQRGKKLRPGDVVQAVGGDRCFTVTDGAG